jgi:aminoglycoside phosphotransferase (APT) family kinase protein
MLDLVGNLARLHGPFWDNPQIKSLKTQTDYLRRTGDFLDFPRRCAVGMERARELIPARLLGQSAKLYEATVRSMHLATDSMPRTLLHGDCHAGQTYRTRDGAMGLADWQGLLQGTWAMDFAYLVNSGLEPDDRRAWQDDLLRHYIAELVRHGGPQLSFDEVLLAYRQQSFWPYTAWAFTIGRAFYQPKMQPVPTCRAIVHRTATAIDDLDALAALGL